jgi:hypothetical protein
MVGVGGTNRSTSAGGAFEALGRRILFALPVVVLLGLAVRSEPAPGLREDEVQCEEALKHLENCCKSSFASNLSCTYVDNGCDEPTLPDLEPDESVLVRAMSCHELTAQGAQGYCQRQFGHSVSGDEL